MITGESRPVAKQPGDQVVAGTVAAGRQPAGPGHRGRRGDGAVRDHAAGGRGPGVAVARAGARRSGRGAALLRRAWRRRDHAGRLDGARAAGGGADPHRHRAGHRLPACPGPGHPAGDRHQHHAGRAQWPAGERPPGARAGARGQGRHLRQDRHADPRRAGGGRHRGGAGIDEDACWRWRPPSKPTRSTRWRAPSCAPPTERGIAPRRASASRRSPAGARRPRSTAGTCAVGGPRLRRGAGPAASVRASPRPPTGWADRAARCSSPSADGAIRGALALEDEIRPESAEAVSRLHEMGLRVAMITGDAQAVADSVARRIGIDETRRRGAAGRQGSRRATLPGGRRAGGDGRRRGQRRAGAGAGRRGHRHRRRHRRGGRVGGHRAGAQRPARRGRGHRPEPGDLPQDGPEPGLGHGLQRHRHPGGGRACSSRSASRCR